MRYKINPDMRKNFPQIVYKTSKRFSLPMSKANKYKVSISIDGKHISNIKGLAYEISRYNLEVEGLENSRRTLELFRKAISITSNAAGWDIVKPYTYDLQLDKFLPKNLVKAEPRNKALAFLAEKQDHVALEKLWEMDVVKRVSKEKANDAVALDPFGKTKAEADDLIPSMFSEVIQNAVQSKVDLSFRQTEIRKAEDLAGEVDKNGLSQNVRTHTLFEKSLKVVARVARENAGLSLKFHFDLSMLAPDNLKMRNVQDKEICDILTTRHDRLVIDFLQSIHALRIKFSSVRPEDNGATIGSPQELLYPKRP